MKFKYVACATLALGLISTRVDAQDRPFLFSASTSDANRHNTTIHYDAGLGERAFDVVDGEAEQRVGIRTTFGNGIILMARVGISPGSRDTRTSQQAEVLYNLLHSRETRSSLALGMGMRHETGGVNVLTGRVAAGRRFDLWRIDGNALFEKPFSSDRDAVDLITSAGVSRRLTRVLYAGIEAIGEDLEGFWEPNEAEGGARLMVGPSLRIAPPSARWQANLAGGPIVHATRSGIANDAQRSLAGSPRNGYAVRASLSYGF